MLVFGGYVHMHVPRNTTTWVPGRVLARGGGQAGDPDACDGRLRRECDRVHDGLHRARDPRPPSPHLVAYTASVTHVSQGCPSSLETGVCPAPPWPRVWTLQNVSSAVSCSSPASWSIFSVPLRPRCLWSDSRPRSLRHQGAAGSGGQALHPANQQHLVSAHSAKTASAPEIISERQQQLQRPGGLHPLHGDQVIMRAADC